MFVMALLTSIPAKATELEYSAQFLRLDSHRLYLWIEGDHFLNPQFVIMISHKGEKLDEVPIAGTAGAVVVSQRLPDYLVNLLSTDSVNCKYEISFPIENLADTILVGIPRDLEFQFYSLFAGGLSAYLNSQQGDSLLPIWYKPVLYDSDRDADVDLSIGAVDLLFWPESDTATFSGSETTVYPSTDHLEFALITAFGSDELTATALNYCLRGIFTDSADSASSYLLDDHDFNAEFPQDANSAALLYSQMRERNRVSKITMTRTGLYTGILDLLQAKTSECGGELDATQFSDSGAVSLFLTPIFQPARIPEQECRESSQRWILSVANELPLAEQLISPADSCVSDSVLSASCVEQLSHYFASSARVIPLGRQRLVFIAGSRISVFSHSSALYDIHSFYRLRNHK